MKKIYLNEEQCRYFYIDYYKNASLKISCRSLRESKEYDSLHKDFFDKYPNDIFYLERKVSYPPGWFDVFFTHD